MRFARYVSLVDVVVAVMVLFVVLLPPRKMRAVWAASANGDRYTLALAEARVIDDQARPAAERDGALVAELARRLGKAGFQDWAAEAAARGAKAASAAPSQWRALLATSVAYVDRLDAVPALDYAKRALAACTAARALDERVCPSWEEVRMDFYTRHLQAGVASGIDAHKDPRGFRRAGEAALRTIRARESTPGPAAAPTAPAAPAAPPAAPAAPPAAR